MTRLRRFTGLVSFAALFATSSRAEPRPTLVLERAVLVMRHNIRAPLTDEVPEGTSTGTPWPRWPVAHSQINPHGERAMAIAAAEDRRLLAAEGLLMRDGCPPPGTVRIRANSSDRTIVSGEAFVRGFAPIARSRSSTLRWAKPTRSSSRYAPAPPDSTRARP